MNKKELQPMFGGNFSISLKDISDIMTRISEEDETFDRALNGDIHGISNGNCLDKLNKFMEQFPEVPRKINTAIIKATDQIEKEEQILSSEEIVLAEENWQRIKKS